MKDIIHAKFWIHEELSCIECSIKASYLKNFFVVSTIFTFTTTAMLLLLWKFLTDTLYAILYILHIHDLV